MADVLQSGRGRRVFDRLVRLDDGRNRADGGAGLGLPIARGLARAQGGELVCLPREAGARFRVTLRAAALQEPRSTEEETGRTRLPLRASERPYST